MTSDRKKNRMSTGIFTAIIALAWPTMLEQLMQTAVQYIDTAMVGSLGTDAIAAVGSTTTVNWLVLSTVSALAVGFLSVISRALGAGDEEFARRASAQSVFAVAVVGIFFTAVTLLLSPFVPLWMRVEESIRPLASRYFFILYASMLARVAITVFSMVLRSAGDSKSPMIVGVVVNVINVVLNFLLIYPTSEYTVFGKTFVVYGADWGVEGAALASSVAFFAGGVLISLRLWFHKKVSPRGMRILPDMEILLPTMKVALPNMLQRFATSFGYVVFASMINFVGPVATAAHTVANTVESAFYIPGYGMQAAAATLAGNAYGANDKKRLKKLAKMTVIIETILMLISGALLFIFAPVMVDLFIDDKAAADLAAVVLRMVALSEPFYGVSIVLEGMLQGMGKTTYPFAVNVTGMWGVRILGTAVCIFAFGMGLVSAWSCMIMHNLLLFGAFSLYWLVIMKKYSPKGYDKVEKSR